jgi:hypothetical protein
VAHVGFHFQEKGKNKTHSESADYDVAVTMVADR